VSDFFRYRLTVEYDGTNLYGWQRQDGLPTGQRLLEDAVHSFSGERVTSQCAGRTDAGVHALGQVIHIDLSKEWQPFRIMEALNFYLKKAPVSIVDVEPVSEEFHARFSAKGRRYLYRIINRRAPLALEANRALHVVMPLDMEAMQDAAEELLGHHDFTTFRDSQCQSSSPMKTLDELRFERISDEEIHVHAASRSFLHHQVRNMVGSLVLVGTGKWTRQNLADARDARDRKAGGPTVSASGLYLVSVSY